MKAGIIGAVDQEVKLLFAALSESGKPVRVAKRGALEFHEGTLGGCTVVAVCCGVGKVNAALCAQILISEFGVECVINTGAAGGIDPRLAVLDMVACTDAVQHDFDVTAFGYEPGRIPGTETPFFAADARLRKLALDAYARVRSRGSGSNVPEGMGEAHRMIEGRVASGDVFVHDEGLRSRIVSTFAPACVEMEGAAVAQVCKANGIPFAVLRSVSDLAGKGADMSYDEFSRIASEISAHVVMEIARSLAVEERDVAGARG